MWLMGLTMGQWAVLFGRYPDVEPTYEGGKEARRRYFAAFRMHPEYPSKFGIEPDTNFSKAAELFTTRENK